MKFFYQFYKYQILIILFFLWIVGCSTPDKQGKSFQVSANKTRANIGDLVSFTMNGVVPQTNWQAQPLPNGYYIKCSDTEWQILSKLIVLSKNELFFLEKYPISEKFIQEKFLQQTVLPILKKWLNNSIEIIDSDSRLRELLIKNHYNNLKQFLIAMEKKLPALELQDMVFLVSGGKKNSKNSPPDAKLVEIANWKIIFFQPGNHLSVLPFMWDEGQDKVFLNIKNLSIEVLDPWGKQKQADYIAFPWWHKKTYSFLIWIIGILTLLILLFYLLMRWQKNKYLQNQEKKLPPWEEFNQNIKTIKLVLQKEQNVFQAAENFSFALRQYLSRELQMNALEMDTSTLVQNLSEHSLVKNIKIYSVKKFLSNQNKLTQNIIHEAKDGVIESAPQKKDSIELSAIDTNFPLNESIKERKEANAEKEDKSLNTGSDQAMKFIISIIERIDLIKFAGISMQAEDLQDIIRQGAKWVDLIHHESVKIGEASDLSG